MMESLTARLGKTGVERLVAGLVSLMAAVVVLLVPVETLQALVLGSGLPAILPAADPPLGMTAVILLALGAGVICFVVTYGIMLLLDRVPRLFEEAEEIVADLDPDVLPAPKVRRRDQHPDAPVRAPLSALRDLGDPDGPPLVAGQSRRPLTPVDAEKAPARSMPWRRDKEEEEIGVAANRLRRFGPGAEASAPPEPDPSWAPQAGVEPEPAPTIELATWSQPQTLEVVDLRAEQAVRSPDRDPHPDDVVEPEPFEPAPELPRSGARVSQDEPVDQASPEKTGPEPVTELHPRRPSWFDGAGENAGARVTGQESIADLMARLERALERHLPVEQESAPVVAANAEPGTAEPMDTRLQSALESLKRFAPQSG